MTKPYVKQTTDNGIATIEFFHPAHNSLPGDILDKLVDAIGQAGKVNPSSGFNLKLCMAYAGHSQYSN